MNSTRTSKSRDATSLHPARKSNPRDLTYSPIVQSSTPFNTEIWVWMQFHCRKKKTKRNTDRVNWTSPVDFWQIKLGFRLWRWELRGRTQRKLKRRRSGFVLLFFGCGCGESSEWRILFFSQWRENKCQQWESKLKKKSGFVGK